MAAVGFGSIPMQTMDRRRHRWAPSLTLWDECQLHRSSQQPPKKAGEREKKVARDDEEDGGAARDDNGLLTQADACMKMLLEDSVHAGCCLVASCHAMITIQRNQFEIQI